MVYIYTYLFTSTGIYIFEPFSYITFHAAKLCGEESLFLIFLNFSQFSLLTGHVA